GERGGGGGGGGGGSVGGGGGGERRWLLPLSGGEGLSSWVGREVVLGIRPEAIELAAPGQAAGTVIEADLEVVEPTGADTLAYLRVDGAEVVARLKPQEDLRPGARLSLALDMGRASLFDPES